MTGENYTGALAQEETYVDESEAGDEETIGFISYAMLDKLMALKMAEGHESFESMFEQLLKEHAELRAQQK
jgi:hypothetical protein